MLCALESTVKEVCLVLALADDGDDYDPTGETIAKDMLDGVIEFEPVDLLKLAEYKGVTIDELIMIDESLKRYKRTR